MRRVVVSAVALALIVAHDLAAAVVDLTEGWGVTPAIKRCPDVPPAWLQSYR